MGPALRITNDAELVRIVNLVKKGILPAAENINGTSARYNVGSKVAFKTVETIVPRSVYREQYALGDDAIRVVRESLENERGSFSHYIDAYGTSPARECVSIGDQLGFVKSDDGFFIQPALGRFPARIVTEGEIHDAINYVKGVGSVEAYSKLLRTARA